jgi:hypothetical protein
MKQIPYVFPAFCKLHLTVSVVDPSECFNATISNHITASFYSTGRRFVSGVKKRIIKGLRAVNYINLCYPLCSVKALHIQKHLHYLHKRIRGKFIVQRIFHVFTTYSGIRRVVLHVLELQRMSIWTVIPADMHHDS